MTKRPTPPSHNKILDYWFNSPEAEVLIGWESFDNIAECSMGHWFCWGCGLKVSSTKRLEKCHIIPHSLGGSNEPSNYYLLCCACHTESPDTAIPSIFFKWVKNKKSYSEQYLNDIYHLLSRYDFEKEDEGSILDSTDDMLNHLSSHGGRIVRSSVLGIIEHVCV